MHVLIAPNAFKNSLSALDAAAAIADGLRSSRFAGTCTLCPVGDGGDGTADLLLRHLGGVRIGAAAHDPLGREVDCHFGLVEEGRTAVIEFAEASGLRHLRTDELDALRATSFGTGELIKCALDRGVHEIVLCVGGSATVDCAAGILEALGVEFLDGAGLPLRSVPEHLLELASVGMTGVDHRIRKCTLTVVCDVTNPLLGERGAAAVFGPQKGATVQTVRALEARLARFGDIVRDHTGKDIAHMPRGGAAGGVAAGLFGLLDARLVDGIEYVFERIGFDALLEKADIVITGEGAIDDQTVSGKAPGGVAARAHARGAFVIGLAGHVPPVASPLLRSYFDVLIPIANGVMTAEQAMGSTAANLRRTAGELGNVLALHERATSSSASESRAGRR